MLNALVVMCVLLASGCAAGTTPSTNSQGNLIYDGLAGQELVYLASGTSRAFKRALKASLIANFEKRTGVSVKIDTFCCGISKLAGMVDAGNVTWDVLEWATPTDAKLAEANNLLVKLDPAIVRLDKLREDAHDAYGFNFGGFASMVVWNTDAFPLTGKHPTTLEDVFDTATFPGKRCMYNYPQFGGVLEAAALASGVSPEKLYPIDIDRALTQLNKIKGSTIFWGDTAQGVQALLTGSCKIGIGWNGPMYDAIQQNLGAKVAVAWGHAIAATSPISVAKGTAHLKAAQALLKWWIEDN